MIDYLLQRRHLGAEIFISGMLPSLMRLKDPLLKITFGVIKIFFGMCLTMTNV